MHREPSRTLPVSPVCSKPTLERGEPTTISCVEILGQTYALGTGPIRIIRLEDEWYEDVANPTAVVSALKERPARLQSDLFTFWQRLPEGEPKFDYPTHWEELAVLPIVSHEHWWKTQIKSRVRNQIRKCEKDSVTVRSTTSSCVV